MYSWVYGVDDFMENLLEMNIKMSYSVKTYWKVKIAKKKIYAKLNMKDSNFKINKMLLILFQIYVSTVKYRFE